MTESNTTDKWLLHVTLTTGHVRKSYRHEVKDEVIGLCRGLLTCALTGPTEIPGLPGCTMTAESTRKALLVSIKRDGVPLVTMGVARHSLGGASLWKLLTEVGVQVPIHESIKGCLPEPWCVARLEPGLALMDEEMCMMLGDFERSIAWAFMEKP